MVLKRPKLTYNWKFKRRPKGFSSWDYRREGHQVPPRFRQKVFIDLASKRPDNTTDNSRDKDKGFSSWDYGGGGISQFFPKGHLLLLQGLTNESGWVSKDRRHD